MAEYINAKLFCATSLQNFFASLSWGLSRSFDLHIQQATKDDDAMTFEDRYHIGMKLVANRYAMQETSNPALKARIARDSQALRRQLAGGVA